MLCSFLTTPPWFGYSKVLYFSRCYNNWDFFPDFCFWYFTIVYKNALNFWISTLYLTALANSLIRFSSFLVVSIRISMYTTMSSSMTDLLPPFQLVCLLFLFFCLIAMARTSNTILNRSGEGRDSCLLLILVGELFSFYPLSMMLALGLSYMAFIMLRYVPTTLTLLSVFIINWCCTLPNAFSASIDMIVWLLPFLLLM